MSSMRKAAAAVAVTAEDSVWIKMVAWHLLRLGLLIVLASALGKARGGVLPFPAWKQEAGVGWRGAEQLHLFCSRQQCEAALPCQTFSKHICGTALERVKAGFMCLGTCPALLNPRVASCPFHPGAMLLGDWQKHRESAVINAAGRAVPSEGSWLLCHFPGAILGNYPYLWQENRLLMHQHSCFDTFDE